MRDTFLKAKCTDNKSHLDGVSNVVLLQIGLVLLSTENCPPDVRKKSDLLRFVSSLVMKRRADASSTGAFPIFMTQLSLALEEARFNSGNEAFAVNALIEKFDKIKGLASTHVKNVEDPNVLYSCECFLPQDGV